MTVVARNLEGRVAIVTGGGGGIGGATCERLALAGATVAVADIRLEAAVAVAERIKAEGLRAEAFQVDLAREEEIVRLVDAVVAAFGRIDILHNNAVLSDEAVLAADLTLLDMTAELWDRVFAVNLRGPMLLSKHVVPHMLKQGAGVIINTSSGASENPSVDARTAYGPSKAGLESLTRYIGVQYGRQNIRCNAILPGAVLTPPMRKLFTPEGLQALADRTMLGRASEPEDIAAMVHFLASDDARQITGQLIRVDNGRV